MGLWQRVASVAAVVLVAAAAASPQAGPGVTSRDFGRLPSGEPVRLYTLAAGDVTVSITPWGGVVTSILTPDRDGRAGDIVLGFDTLDQYLQPNPFFGAIVGRYGNRIGGARFTLDGRTYTLAKNNGANSLHGGVRGFDKVLWSAREVPVAAGAAAALELTHVSPDGDEGFPGKLTATVTYTLTADAALRIDYRATADKPTVVNLTNHSYFNLNGQASGNILDHLVTLHAERYTPVDDGLIPTGAIVPVAGTPFDFRSGTAIGARIDADDPQLRYARGYDHNFVVDGPAGTLRPAARVVAKASGRTLAVETTEPGIQFYSGNFLDGTLHGKGGVVYHQRSGLCLETQHYPDSPNQPAFPSVVLRPGAEYRSTTVYRFGVEPPR